MDHEYTVGDTSPILTWDVSASVIGATAINVSIKRPDETVITKGLSTGVVVTDAANGLGSMSWVAGDLNQSGDYRVEVEVTFATGLKQTFAKTSLGKANRFHVRDQYA